MKHPNRRILFVDSAHQSKRTLQGRLSAHAFEVKTTTTVVGATAKLQVQTFSMVLLTISPQPGADKELLRSIRIGAFGQFGNDASLPIVVLCEPDQIDSSIRSLVTQVLIGEQEIQAIVDACKMTCPPSV